MSFLLYLAEAGASLALFYVIYEAFLRKETTFALNRFYLVAAAGLSFAVPLLRLTSPFFTATAPGPEPIPSSIVPLLAGSSGPSSGLAGLAAGWAGSAFPLSVGDILLFVYAAGVAVCVVRRARLLVRLGGFVRRGPVVRTDGLKVVSIVEDLSPFSFLGYVFLNETTIEPRERDRILAHECVHVRERHTLDVLLMELASTLQWFNPLVWPYRKRLQETHEYLADAAVVAQGCGQAEYQLLLLERHVGAGAFELANNLRQSQIKRRILMLSKSRSRGPARLKPLLLLPLAALLCALAFAQPKPAASASGPPGQEKTGTAESAAAAKQKLEDLRFREASLLERYTATKSLSEKGELLDKLREILRAQEECAWIISGKTGLLPPPPPIGGGQAPDRRREEEIYAKKLQMAKELELQVQDLKRMSEELRIAIEKTEDLDKRAEYKAQLAAVYRKIEEIKATPRDFEKRQVVAEREARIRDLEHLSEELQIAVERSEDPDKKAEYKARLAEVRRAIEEIGVAPRGSERSKLESQVVVLEMQLEILKHQEKEFAAWLKAEADPERRAEADKSLKKNQAKQEEILILLSKLKKDELRTVR